MPTPLLPPFDLVITAGNSLAGDDAAGPLCYDTLLRLGFDPNTIFDTGADILKSIGRIVTARSVLVIDAAVSGLGLPPGSVFLTDEIDLIDSGASTDAHALSLVESVKLLKFTASTGASFRILGIEPVAGRTGFGQPISPAVSSGVMLAALIVMGTHDPGREINITLRDGSRAKGASNEIANALIIHTDTKKSISSIVARFETAHPIGRIEYTASGG